MKILRHIIFIPIMFLVISTIYLLLPVCMFSLLNLSKYWLFMLLIFFGGLIIGLFAFIPGIISWLFAKISPNKIFAFKTTVIISVLLAVLQVFNIWTNQDLSENGLVVLVNIILTLLIFGFAASISVGAGNDALYEHDELMSRLLRVGAFTFNAGIFLSLSLIALKLSHISLTKTYPWFMGIWHGIFAIPNWILSWFVDDVFCKAPKSTFAYSVWWWISLVFTISSALGSSRRSN